MDDLTGFPKFQWSAFPHGKDGEQLVVRGNDLEKFVLDVEAIQSKLNMSRSAEQLVAKVENHARVCSNCGSEMEHKSGVKNGKKWGGWFCTQKCGAVPQWD